MKKLNTLLQYREPEYFLDIKPDEHFLFETINPIVRVAKLSLIKQSSYFDYSGFQIKTVTTPCVALSELNGLKVCHIECPEFTGRINAFYALDCTSFIGVVWDSGLGHLKLRANYFWNDPNNLLTLDLNKMTKNRPNSKYPEFKF